MKRIVAAFFCFLVAAVHAAEPGDSVVLVYNTRVPDSKKVADHYAKVRNVPANQIVGLALPLNEAITRADFRKELEKPLLDVLVKRKLIELSTKARPKNPPFNYTPVIQCSVRYIVLCYGVPLKITQDPSVNEPQAANVRPELLRNDAAVDSELSLLLVSRDKYPITGPVPNPHYGQTNRAAFTGTNNVLIVARLDGPTADIALRLVDKAVQAETNGFWGRAYFDARGLTNGEYKMGDDWIRLSGVIARQMGFETIVDDAPSTFSAGFPMSQIALYAGWYDGHVSGPFAQPNVEFMPGAFAYHLHSYSATTIRSAEKHWVGPLLAKGATITFGSVEEPYLSGTPHVGVFIERLIWNRFTFGEAAMAAQQVLSWQTTVVGDPLYRPFGELPEVLHRRLEAVGNPAIEWSHLRVVNLNMAAAASTPAELLQYLQQIAVTTNSAILEEKHADILRESGNLTNALTHYWAATKLKPSRLQKVRLLLRIAEIGTLTGTQQNALEAYTELIASTPNYPNLPMVYSQAISAARALGKTNEAARLESAATKASAPPK